MTFRTDTCRQLYATESTYGAPWLTGLTLLDKGAEKGDKVYVADNSNGFWIMYL